MVEKSGSVDEGQRSISLVGWALRPPSQVPRSMVIRWWAVPTLPGFLAASRRIDRGSTGHRPRTVGRPPRRGGSGSGLPRPASPPVHRETPGRRDIARRSAILMRRGRPRPARARSGRRRRRRGAGLRGCRRSSGCRRRRGRPRRRPGPRRRRPGGRRPGSRPRARRARGSSRRSTSRSIGDPPRLVGPAVESNSPEARVEGRRWRSWYGPLDRSGDDLAMHGV